MPDAGDPNRAVFVGTVMGVYPGFRGQVDSWRRAQLSISERFTGATAAQVEVLTGLDEPSCGFEFAEGKSYLVEAFRSSLEEHWRVQSCSRTQKLEHAADDVRVLRAWKAGRRLPAWIQGDSGPGLRIRLRGAGRVMETVSDGRGRFAFPNLEPGTYEIGVASSGQQARTVDLTQAWCAQVSVAEDPWLR